MKLVLLPADNLPIFVTPLLREEAKQREKGGGPSEVGWEQQ